MDTQIKHIAIIGGGPSGMFVLKRLIEDGPAHITITVFEGSGRAGCGMPYSKRGANAEHVTNVSGNEIPQIVTSIKDWVHTQPTEILDAYGIERNNFNDYKVLPRLFFGEYLSAQFGLLLDKASAAGIPVTVHLQTSVTDVIDKPNENETWVEAEGLATQMFDTVIICSGHTWPLQHEGILPGYYDSPYPPAKLEKQFNHPVALKGAGLTAIDAIRTLSRQHGYFTEDDGYTKYCLNKDAPGFTLVMHSRSGLLPAVRFHLEDTHLHSNTLLTEKEIQQNRDKNGGFLQLDYVFENDFKEGFKEKDPGFYNRIKDMPLEGFVEMIMQHRHECDAFELLKAEYKEADRSIKRHESIYWKEALGTLSFAMNYPAKHFSAEDMLRLQKVLHPLIALVIAYIPQSSAKELLALHRAGILHNVAVGHDSTVTPLSTGGANYTYTDNEGTAITVHYKTFIDCTGQKHLPYYKVPFKSLVSSGTVSPAVLPFKDAAMAREALKNDPEVVIEEAGGYFLKVPGITINDNFQVINAKGKVNPRLYMMAVPYIGGYNPDYSGLDFCEEASARITEHLFDIQYDKSAV